MIKINIIPEKIKKEIKLNFIFNLIQKSIYIGIIFSSIIAIILMISEHTLLITLAKEVNGSSLSFKSNANTSENKVTDINNKLSLLETVQSDYTRWSIFLNFISRNVPEGVKLNKLQISKENKSVSFSGNAKTRDNLLSFKKILEDSKIFTEVDFPIKNLLQKENINFEIKSKIKIDEIK